MDLVAVPVVTDYVIDMSQFQLMIPIFLHIMGIRKWYRFNLGNM